MDTYLMPIKTAIIFFPLLAFLITLPYMFFQYRKYGSINKLRTLIIYSFILYFTVAYFLIILPLPSFEEVANMTTPRVQLVPFTFVKDFLENTSLVIANPSTYLPALKEPYLYQVLYNLILLLPLGIYLRYYFKCGLLKTIGISFLVSLFFELTQLSGLYFIYSRGYRLFDVDDLIINTLGGSLGYLFSPLFTFFLPTREEIDEKSYIQGRKVSFLRRMFAFIIDQIVILTIVFILDLPCLEYLLVYFVYYMLLTVKTKGVTLGKKLLKIRVTDLNGETCKWYQYTFRYFLQYVFVFLIPPALLFLVTYFHNINSYILLFVSIIITLFYLGYLFVKLCSNVFGNKMFLYEKISKTTNWSMIKVDSYVEEEKIDNEEENDEEET